MELYILIGAITICSALWILAMVDIARVEFKIHWHHALWYFLIWILPVIGAIVYFQAKKHLIKESHKFSPQFMPNNYQEN